MSRVRLIAGSGVVRIALCLALLLTVGCRRAQPPAPSPSAEAEAIPRYTSNVVQPATSVKGSDDAVTTTLVTTDSFDTVVAFFDAKVPTWTKMAMPAQHYQQAGNVVVPTKGSPGGNRGLVRWTEMKSRMCVTATDRDGKVEISEWVPKEWRGNMQRRPAGDVEREVNGR